MAKYKVQKGDKILARTASVRDENTNEKIGGHMPYEKPLTVSRAYAHRVSTKERGYVHNNNILGKQETDQHE